MADIKRVVEQQSTNLTVLRTDLGSLRQQLKTQASLSETPTPVQEVSAVIPDYVVQPKPVLVESPQPIEVLTESVPKSQPVISPDSAGITSVWRALLAYWCCSTGPFRGLNCRKKLRAPGPGHRVS